MRGYQSYSHPSQSPGPSLPTLRLGNAYPFVGPTRGQWFDPYAALKAKIKAAWNLDEASGATAVDATGNGYDLTDSGTVGTDTGKISGARAFSASTKRLYTANEALFRISNDFTICGWVKGSGSGTNRLWLKGGPVTSATGEWETAIYNGGSGSTYRVYVFYRVGGTQLNKPGPVFPFDNAYHFVVLQWDVTEKMFSISVDMGDPVNSDADLNITAGTGEFSLGSSQFGFVGSQDAVAFADSYLSRRELDLLFNNGFGFQLPG